MRRWKEKSGKSLDSDVKASVFTGGMQNQKVWAHSELNAICLDSYTKVRAEILNLSVARRAWARDAGDGPMRIGALSRKAKG